MLDKKILPFLLPGFVNLLQININIFSKLGHNAFSQWESQNIMDLSDFQRIIQPLISFVPGIDFSCVADF